MGLVEINGGAGSVQHYPIPLARFGTNPNGENLWRIVFTIDLVRAGMIGGKWPDGREEYRFRSGSIPGRRPEGSGCSKSGVLAGKLRNAPLRSTIFAIRLRVRSCLSMVHIRTGEIMKRCMFLRVRQTPATFRS